MATTNYNNGNYFKPVRSGQHCPICSKKDGRCSIYFSGEGDVIFYACRNVPSSDGMTANGLHKHFESNSTVDMKEVKRIRDRRVQDDEITPEILEIRDKVNRRIPELMVQIAGTKLFDRDKDDLIRRGLTEKEIEHMGIHSAPFSPHLKGNKGKRRKYRYYDAEQDTTYNCLLETAISKELYREFGDKLLVVAGFNKRKSDKGDYISMTTKFKHPITDKYTLIQGYFIPYHNEEGQRVSFQYRLTVPVYDRKGQYTDMDLEVEKALVKVYNNKYEKLADDILNFQQALSQDSEKAYERVKQHFASDDITHNISDIVAYIMKLSVQKIRYRWWVGQSSTGSPTDFYTPTTYREFTDSNGKKIRIILITEGALKGKIACEKFGCQGLFMGGVTMYHQLINTLNKLEKKTGIKYHLITALDMDKYDNFKELENGNKFYPILKAESTLLGLLKGRGSSVAILEWSKKIKGVDDALMANLKKKYKIV